MARRAKGEGTIFFDHARSRWVGQLPAAPGPYGKRRRGRKVSGKTRKEVAQKLNALRAGAEPINRERQSLRQLLEWYVDEHLPEDRTPDEERQATARAEQSPMESSQ